MSVCLLCLSVAYLALETTLVTVPRLLVAYLHTHTHTHTSRITIDFLKQFTISLCVPDVYENTSAK